MPRFAAAAARGGTAFANCLAMANRWIARAADLAGSDPVLWESLTWPAVAALREAGHELVLIPVGATEQHGPHLPLSTDSAIATAACAYASARTGVPMLPVVSYAVSVGHTKKWPGTVSLLHDTFSAALRQVVEWLLPHGFRRVLFVNSHFGNDAILRVTVDRLRTDHLGSLFVATLNTFSITPAVWHYFTSDGEDIHANKAETDLMLYLDPESCDLDALPGANDPDRTAGLVFPHPVALTSINGVTGRPSEATAARGRELLVEIGDALAAKVKQAQIEEPPLELDMTTRVVAPAPV